MAIQIIKDLAKPVKNAPSPMVRHAVETVAADDRRLPAAADDTIESLQPVNFCR